MVILYSCFKMIPVITSKSDMMLLYKSRIGILHKKDLRFMEKTAKKISEAEGSLLTGKGKHTLKKESTIMSL